MTGFLLDTNVVSDLMKRRPDQGVTAWVEGTAEELLHLSVITLGEVRRGIDLLANDDPKRAALLNWLDHQVRTRFAGRVLPFDEGVADRWGQIEAAARKRRVTLPTIDAQLAATALHHNLTFVTRNVSDVAAVSVPASIHGAAERRARQERHSARGRRKVRRRKSGFRSPNVHRLSDSPCYTRKIRSATLRLVSESPDLPA